MITELVAKITDADMVLVGLGEDFDRRVELAHDESYKRGFDYIKEANLSFLLPGWNAFCLEKMNCPPVRNELAKLAELLKDKNYFVVSVSTNPQVAEIPWKHDRIVMPCGSSHKKQCMNGCDEVVLLNESDERNLNAFFEQLYSGVDMKGMSPILGTCSQCGMQMCLNNIFAEHYNEQGYLDQWSLYMKWLQGTVNRKLLILELGVGLSYPSVIRWPFEKVSFYNQKSYFYRVHEKLYQLTPEMKGKGCGISQNAIEWLRRL